jgi:hypothetical protein
MRSGVGNAVDDDAAEEPVAIATGTEAVSEGRRAEARWRCCPRGHRPRRNPRNALRIASPCRVRLFRPAPLQLSSQPVLRFATPRAVPTGPWSCAGC